MYGLIRFRSAAPAFVALGRGGTSHFRAADRDKVQQLLGAITLADAALASVEASAPSLKWLSLTKRQQDLVAHVSLGLTNAGIASAMGISPNTVRNRLAELCRRCGARNRAGLVRVAMGAQSPEGSGPNLPAESKR